MQSRRATGGVEGKRAHSILVMGQIALTLLLLTSAAAAINGFVRIVHANLGYDPQNVMSVGIPVHQNAHVSWRIVLTISSSSVSTSRPCRKWFRRAFRPTPRRPGTKTTGASRFWGGPATNSGARV